MLLGEVVLLYSTTYLIKGAFDNAFTNIKIAVPTSIHKDTSKTYYLEIGEGIA